MTLAAREHRAAVVEVEMSGLQNLDVDQPNIALPADDLLSHKSRILAHPDEVVVDQELTLADKRSLLALWASDALGVEDSPSLRQLPSGAVVLGMRAIAGVARPHRSVQIPFDRDHPIRSMLIIHSGGLRSSIPVIPIIPEMTAPFGGR
jgi:hypothetical protein